MISNASAVAEEACGWQGPKGVLHDALIRHRFLEADGATLADGLCGIRAFRSKAEVRLIKKERGVRHGR